MYWKILIFFISLILSFLLVEDTIENIINFIKSKDKIDNSKNKLINSWLLLLTCMLWTLFYLLNQI